MKHRKLGKTGLSVSELSLGGLFVSAIGGELEQSRAAVQRAVDLGVNYIDTAPGYANSEAVLGQILQGIKAPLLLSTKLGGRPRPFEPQNPQHLYQSVDESLRLLGRDVIDILMIHEPDRPGQYDWWSGWPEITGPVLDVLADLKARGKVRYAGLGGTTAYEICRVMRTGLFDVVLTAFNYSLLWREAEIEVLPLAKQLGMGVIIGSPLQQGALSRRHDLSVPWLSKPRREQFEELYRVSDESGLALPELGLRFVLSNPDVSCVLMGARSAGEVEQNVEAAGKGALPPALLAQLNAIARLVPFRPFEEPAGMGWLFGNASAKIPGVM
ncbi:MAG: aldo/keto reductase [Lentisphaerae bacterium]|nr:aldo/keto reductase [Lentisphaerota bacterium]